MSNSSQITSILEPVREEMVLVEKSLMMAASVDSPRLRQQLNHLLRNSGKRVRPALTLLVGKLYHPNLDLLIPMATAVELLHTATLIHDDAIDDSSLRRGRPTLSSTSGKHNAILAGDYLFAKCAHITAVIGNLRVINLFAQTIMAICSGELEESFSAYDWQQTREHYLQIVGNKTAPLFSAAAESGAILSQAPEEEVQSLKSYGYNLGTAFQIIDDILDFTGEEEEMGKPVGSDLLQGTLTLPAILLIEQHPGDNPLTRVAKGKLGQANLELAIRMIRGASIIQDAYKIAEGFAVRARQELEQVADSPYRRALIELAEYAIERKR